MRLELEPRRMPAPVGEPVVVVVRITNSGDVISGYSLRVLGADPDWVTLDQAEPRLFPGESTQVTITFALPDGLPAGERRMAVQVRELTGERRTAVEELVLDVPGVPQLEVRLDPSIVTAGRRAGFDVVITNEGNTIAQAALVGSDPENRIDFEFDPPGFYLSPGEHTITSLRTSAKRSWFGATEPRPFELRVDDSAEVLPRQSRRRKRRGKKRDEREKRLGTAPEPPAEGTPPDAMGVFVQRPVFSRGVLAMLGLLVAISMFAIVITAALNGVVSRSAADRDLALQVAQARDQQATTGSSSLAGQVLLLSTGEPVEGVSVEAFDESDTAAPLATSATDADGAFAVPSLPAGSYKLRFRGAGFAETWYPAAATDADAEVVTLAAGQRLAGLTVLVGGVPATVAGTVVGQDVSGATVTLELPLDSPALAGQVDPAPGEAPARTSGAVVRSVPIGGDGTFELVQVPSPGVYDLVTSKPGYSTQVQRLDVAAGEARTGIEIQLVDGDGSISGLVTGTGGPIPGATVQATFGETSVRTVSLTQDEVGSFTLRGLPTPGTFTVVVSADGYAPATLNLDLGPGQQLTGVVATLGAAAGTLSGQVTAPDGGAGVTVTVTDGATTRQTVTQSQSPAGSWVLAGLPIPSTYTVTFSRSDLESQVVSVSIDGYGNVTSGAPSANRVDATMRSSTGRIVGTVRQSDASGVVTGPAPNVQVTASSGSNQYVVTTASTPSGSIGDFVLGQLPPGTYTVTFSRKGTSPTSTIVTLAAGQEQRLDPVLVSPAALRGTVSQGGVPTVGAVVDLYLAGQYGTALPPVASATTDATGAYRFDDVDAPAHYIAEVRVSATGAPVATSAPISVQASDQAVYDFALPAP